MRAWQGTGAGGRRDLPARGSAPGLMTATGPDGSCQFCCDQEPATFSAPRTAAERRIDSGTFIENRRDVLALGLTWRDAVSSLIILVVIFAYAAYLQGTSLLLISSSWATTAVVLVLGTGCAVSAAGDLYTRPQPRSGEVFRRIATVIGTIALITGVIGLITGSAHALEILVVATIALWGTATFWHVLTIGSEQ